MLTFFPIPFSIFVARAAALVLLVTLCCLSGVVGCARDEAGETGGASPLPRIELPEPILVSDAPVTCVSGVRLVEHTGNDLWRWRARARLWCAISTEGTEGAAPGDDLVFDLASSAATAGHRYNLAWDDTPVGTPAMALPEGGTRIVIPAALATPGLHVLHLERKYVPGDLEHENQLTRIAYGFGEPTVILGPERAEADLYAARLMARGVTGHGREVASGFLMDGSREGRVEVRTPHPGRLHVTIENASFDTADYIVSAPGSSSGYTLGPGETGTLELPLAAGETTVRVEVQSAAPDRGWYHFGRPWVTYDRERGPGADATPVVLITLDTTRRDALSPYGGDPEVTPVLDAFAHRATVFDAAYSTTSWTLPSHASMMTGLYPSRHGAGVDRLTLEPSRPTLAGLLSKAGYRSLGYPGSFVCSSRYGISQGFSEYLDPEGSEVRGDVLTDQVLKTLPTVADQPLFLFLNYFDPHILYAAPERYRRLLEVDELQPAVEGHPLWERLAAGDVGAWMPIIGGQGPATPAILDYLRASYLAEVSFMDAQLGRLFDGLRAAGLYERALIVLVADHGELLGERGRFSHAARLDPELVEVPLLVKWPHQTEATRVGDLVSIVDLFPTILEAAGLEAPRSDGLLLTRDGIAAGQPERTRVFQEEHESLSHPIPPLQKVAADLYAVQDPRSQRIVWPGDQECFDRRSGTWRLVDCPPDGGDALFERLRELLGTGSTGADAGSAVSDEDREALEALGYL